MIRQLILLTILSLNSVESMGRPFFIKQHGGGYYGGKDSSENSTVEEYTCPSGWTLFDRVPSKFNDNLGAWCVKLITSETAISTHNASALCEAENGVLTAFESEEERLNFTEQARTHIIGHLNATKGSIAIAGNRISECAAKTREKQLELNKIVPCNHNTKVFVLPESAGTNSEFLWNSWAPGEPGHNFWTSVESCLQLHIDSNPSRNGKINDNHCSFDHAPNTPDNKLFWNFGALCGQAPGIESTGEAVIIIN